MFQRRGQTILEYTILIGIITVVLYYMVTGIKRGVQSLLKVTADQVGNQQNADQDFNDIQEGYLVQSNGVTNETKAKLVTETGYIDKTGSPVYLRNISANSSTETTTNTITNGGFTPNQ